MVEKEAKNNWVIYSVNRKGTGEKMFEAWILNDKSKPVVYLGLVSTEKEAKALIDKYNAESFEMSK